MNRREFIGKIVNSGKKIIGTSLLVGALTVNPFLTGNTQSQDLESKIAAETAPEVEWSKTFGGSEHDEAWSVQQTSDNGYIIAGGTKSFGAGYLDFWLIKTDTKGNKEWDKTFGGSGYDCAFSVQQTSDGGFIVAGHTNSFGTGSSDFWLIKTDLNGNKEWDKIFKGVGGTEKAWSVQQTSDNGYIMAGHTYSSGKWNDFWLIKTDQNGNKEWDKTLGGSLDDRAYSVQQTTDGGYIVAGYTESFGLGESGIGDVWLVKLKGNGVMVKENQPESFSLLQNYPNPFNTSTTISLTLPASCFTQLIIYNITGQKIRELIAETMTAGIHNVVWDGMDNSGNAVSSGVYISQLSAGKLVANSRMVLMK